MGLIKALVIPLLVPSFALAGCSNAATDHFNAEVVLSNDERWQEAIVSSPSRELPS